MPVADHSRLRRAAKEAALIVGASSLATIAFFRVGLVSFATPIDYAGDGVSELASVKVIVQTGWNAYTNRLGAPTGYTQYDFPVGGDNLHNLTIKIMSWFIRDPVSLLNAYFLLGFVLVALVAYVVLRAWRVRPEFAVVAALLYSLAPYHMIRGTAHLTLGAYYSVPIICWLVLRIAHGDPVFLLTGPGRRVRLVRGAVLAAVASVVIGSSGTYYALMAVPLAVVAAAMGAARVDKDRRLSVVLGAVVFVGLTVTTIAVNNLPTVLYRRAHGTNPQVAVRYPWEVDDYALRPIELLSPVPGHHVAALRSVAADLSHSRTLTEPSQFLGLVTAIGLVLAVGFALARGATNRRGPPPDPGRWRGPPEPQLAGILIIVLILIGVTGGLSWISALLGLTDLRAWNRVSIVIAFLALVALVVVAERLMSRRSWPTYARPALAALVLIVGLYDQTGGLRIDPRVTRAAYDADGLFVHQIEATLPASSMVFQLPWQPFPEQPPLGTMAQADQLKMFVHSQTLRWSFGGMRGRASDWQEAAVRLPTPQMLDAISAVGFTGLVIDRSGYSASAADELVASVQAAIGASASVTGGVDGHLVFFDLRSERAALVARLGQAGVEALGAQTLDWPTTWWTGGFWYETRTAEHVWHDSRRTGTMVAFNRASAPWKGSLAVQVRSFAPGSYLVDITIGSSVTRVAVTDQWTAVTIPITLAPGETNVHFASNAPEIHDIGDPRTLVFSLQDLTFSAG